MSFARDGGWTTVSYRRRPRRAQFFDRPRDGANVSDRWKDRAFSNSRGSWTTHPFPKRPVPPAGMTYGHPSRTFENNNTGAFYKRTYAAVVRQGFRQGQPRFFRGHFVTPYQRETKQNKNNWIPSEDPLFGPQLRKFYKVIQLVHHLRNVTPENDKTDTKLISRMVEELASLIKPASPTPETLELIMGNAKNWGFSTLLILQDHYKDQLDKALLNVWMNHPRNWKQALQVAKTWAKKRLPRIKQEVLDHAEALIISCQPQNDETMENRPEPTRPPDPQPKQKETRNSTTQTVSKNTIETQTETTTQITNDKHDERIPHTTMTTGTMTDPYREWSPLVESPPDRPPSPKTQRTVTRTQQEEFSLGENNKQLETDNRERVRGPALLPRTPAPRREELLPTLGGTGEAAQRQAPSEPLSLMDLTIRDMDTFFDIEQDTDSDADSDENEDYREAQSGILGPRAPEDTPLPEIEEFSSDPDMPPLERFSEDEEQLPAGQRGIRNPHRGMTSSSPIPIDPQEDQDPEGPELEFLKTFNLSVQEPGTSTLKVIKHIHTRRKMVDWSLNVYKKWLFLGDSNLAQFPTYTIEDLQIDSFPGANFRHISEVIGKAKVHVTVEKTILSFGINNRTQKPRETTVRQIQAAIRTVKQIFPYSEIYVPLINFSKKLPIQEQENLSEVNQHIEKNMPFLPKLDDSLFETIPDQVHWTKSTAKAMFDHWAKELNLRLPRAS